MANKGQQRSGKETKKPKKDATSKPPTGAGVAAPITTQIIKRGKEAKPK